VKARYRLLGRLLPYLRPYWPVLLAGGLLALLVSGAEAFIAWLVKPAMDDIFLKRDVLMLKLLPLALLGVYLLKGGGRFGQSYLMASVGERVIARIRRELYAHIQGMPLAFFASLHSAELIDCEILPLELGPLNALFQIMLEQVVAQFVLIAKARAIDGLENFQRLTQLLFSPLDGFK